MTDVSDLPASIRWYFSAPGAWDAVKEEILEHDVSCSSLRHVWLGHSGGFTALGDIGTCNDCEVTFYNEGLIGQYPPDWKLGDPILQTRDPEDGETYEAQLCECCGRKRREIDA